MAGHGDQHEEPHGPQPLPPPPPPVPPTPQFLHNIHPPPYLDLDESGIRERWLEWKDAWRRYLLLSGNNQQDHTFQSALLLHSIGPQACKIHRGMSFADGEDKDDPEILLKKYDQFFLSDVRDFIERLKFYRRKQLSHESCTVSLSAATHGQDMWFL